MPEQIVAVASGKGGVGKSTVAVNLAAALAASGRRVGLLDADIYGPSVPRMLGVDPAHVPEQRDGMLVPVAAAGLKAMSMGFLTTAETPLVWRGPMAASALMQMLEQTAWDHVDLLILDLPPGTGDIQLTLSQRARLAGAVIVTTPQDIALLDARKAVAMFAKVSVPVLGLVENMAVHVCSACGHREHVFGAGGGTAMAAEIGVPVLASLPLSMALRENADAGRPLVQALPDSAEAQGFHAAARALIDALAARTPARAPTITMGD